MLSFRSLHVCKHRVVNHTYHQMGIWKRAKSFLWNPVGSGNTTSRSALPYDKYSVVFKENGREWRMYDIAFVKERASGWLAAGGDKQSTLAKMLEMGQVPKDKYRFVSYSTRAGFKECSEEYRGKRALVCADWVEKNVPGFVACNNDGVGGGACTKKPAAKRAESSVLASVVGPQMLRNVLGTNVSGLPVIYLFVLGRVRDLREVLGGVSSEKFRDDDIVVKYGLTVDLKRRSGEHEAAFCGKMGCGADFGLLYHVYIDPYYLNAAEGELGAYFMGARWHLRHAKHTELAAVPEHMLGSLVHHEFKRLGSMYCGRTQELQAQLNSESRLNENLRAQLGSQAAYFKELLNEKDARLRDKDGAIEAWKMLATQSKL